MPKKKAAEPMIDCAICHESVAATQYAQHIAAKHSAPAPTTAPASTVPTAPPAVPAAAAPPAPYTTPQPAQIPPAPWASPQQPSVAVTPPPPPAPRNPFINPQVLWQNGGQLAAQIQAVRSAAGVRSASRPDIPDRGGWILELLLDKEIQGLVKSGNGVSSVTTNIFSARVNVGDVRHQRLWARFQQNWLGQRITIRLPKPEDNTRAQWVVD